MLIFVRTIFAVLALLGIAERAICAEPQMPIRKIVETHCAKCHFGENAEGEVRLDGLWDRPSDKASLATWLRVFDVVNAGEMPPADRPAMSLDDREVLTHWIEQQMAEAVKPHVGDPGPVVVRRLTRGEVDRTLHALTGQQLRVSALMPADGAGGEGFANVGSVQSVGADLLESQLEVARFVADRLQVTSAAPLFCRDSCTEGDFANCKAFSRTSAIRRQEWIHDLTVRLIEGAWQVKQDAPLEKASADVHVPPERLQQVVQFFETPIPSENLDPKGTTRWAFRLAGLHEEFAALSATKLDRPEREARIQAMAKVISPMLRYPNTGLPESLVLFQNAFLAETGIPDTLVRPTLSPGGAVTGANAVEKGVNRDLAAQLLTHRQLQEFDGFYVAAKDVVALEKASKAATSQETVQANIRAAEPAHRQWLHSFAAAAWRRPLTAAELGSLDQFYDETRQRTGDHATSLREAVTRVLASPTFWYRAEVSQPGKSRHSVSAHELAVRLSYFLWACPPDDLLRQAAKDSSLLTDAGLKLHARRMLADPRATGLVEEFFLAWLGLTRFAEERNPNPLRFPTYNETLIGSMDAELRSFLADLVRNDQSIDELVCANWTYLDETLARHYGISGVKGSLLRKVDVAQQERGGLLGSGAFLVTTSYSLRTSPVKRGSFLVQEILGKKLPPPPPDAGQLPEDDRNPDRQTVRQRLDAHRENPSCYGCHKLVDPPGFALEAFDAIGRKRTRYDATKNGDGAPVDNVGQTATGRKIVGLPGVQLWMKDERAKLHRQFAIKLTGYALGRGLELTDRPLIDTLVATAAQHDGRIGPIVEQLVLSEQFRSRRGDAAPPQVAP